MPHGVDRRTWLTSTGLATAGLALGRAPSAAAASSFGRFRLGIVTYNVARDWDLDTILKNVREAGLQAVEFRTTHAHGVEPGLDAARRREVRDRCRDAGLLQTSLGTTCEFHSPDPAVVRQNVETCREFVGLARDIGARGVKVRPNGLPEGVPVEKTLEQIGRALAECGRAAADAGVEIWMEVHGRGTQEPARSQRIMEHCGHPSVGVTWNSNPTDLYEGSVRDAFSRLGRYVKCCHVTELWSDYPYRELFYLLGEAGYDRFTLCEIPQSIRPEDGVAFLKCYRALWRELQRR